MKSSQFVLMVCLFMSNLIFANITDPPANTTNVHDISNSEESSNSELFIIRDTGIFGSAIKLKTFVNEELHTKVKHKSYIKSIHSPGKALFSAQLYGKKRKKKSELSSIELQKGQSHYILLYLEAGWWSNRLRAVEITEESAKRYLERNVTTID